MKKKNQFQRKFIRSAIVLAYEKLFFMIKKILLFALSLKFVKANKRQFQFSLLFRHFSFFIIGTSNAINSGFWFISSEKRKIVKETGDFIGKFKDTSF